MCVGDCAILNCVILPWFETANTLSFPWGPCVWFRESQGIQMRTSFVPSLTTYFGFRPSAISFNLATVSHIFNFLFRRPLPCLNHSGSSWLHQLNNIARTMPILLTHCRMHFSKYSLIIRQNCHLSDFVLTSQFLIQKTQRQMLKHVNICRIHFSLYVVQVDLQQMEWAVSNWDYS